MTSSIKQELLRALPSINDLLGDDTVAGWLERYPRSLVTVCLRDAVEEIRQGILDDTGGRCGAMHTDTAYVLAQASEKLTDRTSPHIRGAVNATGIILHTALGRAVWPESVVDSMTDELKGYVTLAIDRETGKRSDRDLRIEYLLTELTGAEAGIVVNNNAAATMLVLAALAAEKEVVVSRGQLVEIGGSFRLPEVMEQSGAKLVEVGATNRTHPKDYDQAINMKTAALLRVHPSNYRVVGFTREVTLAEMSEVAGDQGVMLIDDLGAGSLVGLEQFGLPHEPTVRESIDAGADIVLFSADKLIGAAQGGVIVGRKDLIARIRKHPLARAMRADKSCLMVLERTLQLFRDTEKLAESHPLYRMLATPEETLKARAEALAAAISVGQSTVCEGVGYLGSGSLPTHGLPTWVVKVSLPDMSVGQIAQALRTDEACVFTRIEDEQIVMDVRTITDEQIDLIAQAFVRVGQ
ncbi:MAG: L-seryl-tRNA(Sec) selenium transferase [Phycisphaerales bacterium]|jgi:L-seryl-tRNA(Ser) seleniumtransferase|nr:L-seryl-tRNA(Sec) selenium transferase [Phycisphaerales bacterium]